MNLSTDSSEFLSDNQPSPPDSIKKRLNMHVKRRLLEQATTSSHHSVALVNNTSPLYAVTSPSLASATMHLSPPIAPPPKEPRKYKTQKRQQQQLLARADEQSPLPDSPSPKKRGGRKSSVIKRTQEIQNESAEMHDDESSISLANYSDNEHSPSAGMGPATAGIDGTGEQRGVQHTPDILSMVLNEKKAALMNDPEIIHFLQGISRKLMQQHQQQQQRNTFNR